MENKGCPATKELLARVGRGASRPCRSPSPNPNCRNIAGIIIPPATASSQIGAPKVLQKSAIAPTDNNRLVELNDQAVGVSKTCTGLKNYGAFNASAAHSSGNSPSGVVRTGNLGSSAASSNALSQTPTRFGTKFNISKAGILHVLHMLRDPVADYQETRGVPKDEEITFVTLITSLCTQAYTAAITILVMIWNLMPLVDGIVYFLRFCLDKMIDIVRTGDNKDRALKLGLFFAQVTLIMLIIFLIMGLIFMPVYELMTHLCRKVLSIVSW